MGRGWGRSGGDRGPWLLIGNSRWHWAEGDPAALRCWHEPAAQGLERLGALAPGRWAAVGAVPAHAALATERRMTLAAVPLLAMPPWLGVDRALVGWGAWRPARARGAAAVLVADAGTVLSLTVVDGGRFAGGRLLAGAALQWRAMAAATEQLCDQPPASAADRAAWPAEDPWPTATAAAMRVGVLQGLAAAIAAAWRQLPQTVPAELWLTGGDGPLLEPLLRAQGVLPEHAPELALAALAELSSAPGR